METFKHQKTHHKHLPHLLLHQHMTKDIHYLVQYTRRSSIQIDLKLNQELLEVQVM